VENRGNLKFWSFSILLCGLSGMAVWPSGQREQRPIPAKDRIVVMISIDGFPA
jgi:hypothetical protein